MLGRVDRGRLARVAIAGLALVIADVEVARRWPVGVQKVARQVVGHHQVVDRRVVERLTSGAAPFLQPVRKERELGARRDDLGAPQIPVHVSIESQEEKGSQELKRLETTTSALCLVTNTVEKHLY